MDGRGGEKGKQGMDGEGKREEKMASKGGDLIIVSHLNTLAACSDPLTAVCFRSAYTSLQPLPQA